MKKADQAASKTPARLTRSQRGFLWAFGVPTFLLYVYICIVPMLTSVRDSLFDWDGYGEKVFVGLKNYKEIFTDPVFGTSVKNDLLIVFFKEIVIVVLATLFAMCLTRLRFGKKEGGAYRYLLYLPNILSILVITRVWKFFFELGLFDRLLKMLGIGWTSQNGWLADYPLLIIIFVASWCGIGGFMIILISSINNISQEVYEAADIDGAGVFRQLMQQNVHVRCYAYQMTAERFSDTMWTMQQILFMSADRRLAIFLTDELAKTGGADVRMTHDQIARYMGSAREVVSRLLKYFAGEGLVRLYRGGVTVLDKERLKQIANGT